MSGSLGKIGRYVNEEVAVQNQRTGLLQLKPGFSAGFAKLVLKFVEPQIIAEVSVNWDCDHLTLLTTI